MSLPLINYGLLLLVGFALGRVVHNHLKFVKDSLKQHKEEACYWRMLADQHLGTLKSLNGRRDAILQSATLSTVALEMIAAGQTQDPTVYAELTLSSIHLIEDNAKVKFASTPTSVTSAPTSASGDHTQLRS